MKAYGIVLLGLTMAVSNGHRWDERQSLTKVCRLYHAGKLQEAERAMVEHMKIETRPSPNARVLAIRIFAARGKDDHALRLAQKFVQVHPKDYRAWFALGVQMTRLGGGNPIAALRKSIELNRNHAPSWLWLAKTTIPVEKKVRALETVLILEERGSPVAKEALNMLQQLAGKRESTEPPQACTTEGVLITGQGMDWRPPALGLRSALIARFG